MGTYSRRKGGDEERACATRARQFGADASRILESDGIDVGWDVCAQFGPVRVYIQSKFRQSIRWVKQVVESILKALDAPLTIYAWRLRCDRCPPIVMILEDDFYRLVKSLAKLEELTEATRPEQK
jgi:hypothetical protein